ncbi:GATA transcription factor 16 [Linum grandiflorum]
MELLRNSSKKSLVFGGEKQDKLKEKNKQRSCGDCKATSTPLWRFGPGGPKSLCNACGLKYSKKIRPIKNQAKSPSPSSAAGATTSDESASSPTGPLKVRVVYSSAKGGGVMFRRSPLQPSPVEVKKQKKVVRKLTEEEVQAALCLVALSSCSDFA